MKVYAGEQVRNVGVIGHGGTGKTSLVSAFLYTAGMVNRLGRVDDGTTVTDYDEEEIERKISISTALAFAEWAPGGASGAGKGEKVKINFLDTPGYNIFLNDSKTSLIAADSALITVDAVAGVEVVTEKVWDYCQEYDLPRVFVINKMDRDRSSFERTLNSLREAFGRGIVPLHLPIGEERNFRGVVDLIAMKAYTYTPGGDGKGAESAIPAELEEAAAKAHEALVELVAEGADALMEEFFEKGTLEPGKLSEGLRAAIAEKRVYPVALAAGLHNMGTDRLLDFIVGNLPSGVTRKVVTGSTAPGGDETTSRKVADTEPLSLFVFKTLADPFAGRVSYFKVCSGMLKNEANVTNYVRGGSERFSHIQILQGKTGTGVAEIRAGDIGAVAKLKDTLTGDTLGDKSSPIFYKPSRPPEPSITFAIEPRSRGDEDKISTALHKILDEDLSLRFHRDQQTKELLLSGSGQQHIEVVVSKLKKRYGVEVNLKAPKVPYRETIRGKADVQGRYKKQTGGHGQYGDCKIKMEPLPRGTGFEFENEIFGGSIPKNYIPAVEKGIVEAAAKGFLAGYPVVDFRVILYDGSYHEVDCSDLAFKIAGSLAFKKAMEQARPGLLEPIMNVEVYAPEQFSGDLMGDISGRRGRITGMETRGTTTIIRAQVPMAEMLTYATDLTSMTQGRASYSMEFSHYDYAPPEVAEKIIAQAKAVREGAAVEEEA